MCVGVSVSKLFYFSFLFCQHCMTVFSHITVRNFWQELPIILTNRRETKREELTIFLFLCLHVWMLCVCDCLFLCLTQHHDANDEEAQGTSHKALIFNSIFLISESPLM
jgi:hypothetical protein